jgi:hypothetical protein
MPNTNTNTNTSTNTSTTTLTRYVTNTNTTTNTATATNTNTTTNTATNTVTQTFGSDANNDGFLQVSEIPLDGSGGPDFLDTSPYETTYNYDINIDQDIFQEIIIGEGEFVYGPTPSASYYDPVSGQTGVIPAGDFIGQVIIAGADDGDFGEFLQDISYDSPVYDITQFNDGAYLPGNLSVDDNGATDLGNNLVVNQVYDDGGPLDGFIEITYDFVQTFDQDIVQDVYYEIEIVQDFIQDVEINQTYTIDEVRTETRTRLAGE